MTSIYDAQNYASEYAGKSDNWNNRYREGLRQCGFEMVPWPEDAKRPPDTMDAPLPIPSADGAWEGTHIIQKMRGARITTVFVFRNGMVMTFDQNGKQMPDYQGPKEEALPKIIAAGYKGSIEEREWPL